jgi:glycosyltransferase involved in cell wall biosynthesis
LKQVVLGKEVSHRKIDGIDENQQNEHMPNCQPVPVVVLFEPAADEFSYESKFVPLVRQYLDESAFRVYIVGSSGLKFSLRSTRWTALELPIGNVGYRGPTRFFLYVLSLVLSSLLLVRAIGVSRSQVILSMAGHCYSGFVVAAVGRIMMRRSLVRISEPTRELLRRNRKPGILYVLSCWTEKVSLSLCDAVFMVRDMSDYCKIPMKKSFVIGQGVDIQRFQSSLRVELAEHYSPLIITVARLDSGKGIHNLIDSIGLLTERYPSIGCLIVGWGPELENLRRRVLQRSLTDHLRFIGYVAPERVPSFLKSSDIFVLPSNLEGLPSSVLEAMACGLPVVMCLEASSFADSVRKFGAALIVPSEPKAIANAIGSLLVNPELREELIRSGTQFVERFHDDRRSRESFTNMILNLDDP